MKSTPKGLLIQLPDDRFFHIYRSHVVNLELITDIEKNHRTYQFFLINRQKNLPFNRHRISKFFPKIETYLNIKHRKKYPSIEGLRISRDYLFLVNS